MIESDVVTVRLATAFAASTPVISVSARTVLIFIPKDDASDNCEGIDRDLLGVISLPVELSLPVEFDAARAIGELDDRDLTLRLPLVAGALPFRSPHVFHKYRLIEEHSICLKESEGLQFKNSFGRLYGKLGNGPLRASRG
jgi:hypothetical protein